MSWEELCGHTTCIHSPTVDVDIYFNSYICFLSTYQIFTRFKFQSTKSSDFQYPDPLDFAPTQIFLVFTPILKIIKKESCLSSELILVIRTKIVLYTNY